ncbi:unnamed protein product [Miscanthus lutarioriparius]|uniref:Uncharacterized protein n=1 Tax=Miscanthus lutarioriparius TaxID=422564 RepID=A0A811RND6_9POAL|nr:unnamed protein product [Miscanthus lutarioriparius]
MVRGVAEITDKARHSRGFSGVVLQRTEANVSSRKAQGLVAGQTDCAEQDKGKKMSTDTVPHGNKQQRIDLKSRYDTGAWWAAPGTGAASGREIGAASYRYSYRYRGEVKVSSLLSQGLKDNLHVFGSTESERKFSCKATE